MKEFAILAGIIALVALSFCSAGCTADEFFRAADSAAYGYYGNRYRAQQPAYHPPPPGYQPTYH